MARPSFELGLLGQWRIQVIEFRTAYGDSKEIRSAAAQAEILVEKEQGDALVIMIICRLKVFDWHHRHGCCTGPQSETQG